MTWWMWVVVVWAGLVALVVGVWVWLVKSASQVLSDQWRNGQRGL